MNRFASSAVRKLPETHHAPTALRYKNTALEAAHLAIERLHSTNVLQQHLLDEAASRISDLTKYQDNAAGIIARLKEMNGRNEQETMRHT
jgi:hypothetical protein